MYGSAEDGGDLTESVFPALNGGAVHSSFRYFPPNKTLRDWLSTQAEVPKHYGRI